MSKRNTVPTIGLIAALLFAACATGSGDPTSAAVAVADSGGDVDTTTAGATQGPLCHLLDTSAPTADGLGAAGIAGAKRAANEFGLNVEVRESSEAGAASDIEAFVELGCTLIVTVGAGLSNVTAQAAGSHPDQHFAIIDFEYADPIPNVLTLTFDAGQPSFLAGYLAAGMTESGTVATYGSINIAPVTSLMEGFANGVALYNRRKGTSILTLGWDGIDGTFAGNFDSADDGRTIASDFAQSGADIIFPVAGAVGIGSAEVAKATGSLRIIGVDTDLTVSNPAAAAVYLTSVLKNADAAVVAAAHRVIVDGELGGSYVGTLENGGVGLAPFHDQSDEVPGDLHEELDALSAEIIAGNVSVD